MKKTAIILTAILLLSPLAFADKTYPVHDAELIEISIRPNVYKNSSIPGESELYQAGITSTFRSKVDGTNLFHSYTDYIGLPIENKITNDQIWAALDTICPIAKPSVKEAYLLSTDNDLSQ